MTSNKNQALKKKTQQFKSQYDKSKIGFKKYEGGQGSKFHRIKLKQ